MSKSGAKTITTNKVFDVRRPGRVPAAPTSRPVVVEHQDVQDPLLVGEQIKVRKGSDAAPVSPVAADPTQEFQEPLGAPELSETEFQKDMSVVTPKESIQNAGTAAADAARNAHVADDLGHTATMDSDTVGAEAPSSASSDEMPAESASPAPATADDLLAGTDAPVLEPKVVVSHHRLHASWWGAIGLFLFVIILGTVALDVLLDLGLLKTTLNIPHTDFFAPMR